MQNRQRTRPTHRLHTKEGGDINPFPGGKIIQHKEQILQDRGMGATRVDPCARRDKCDEVHGASRLPQTVASSHNIVEHAPMQDGVGTSRIPQPPHTPHRTPRAKTGKKHLDPQLSPQQSMEITRRSARPYPAQLHRLRLPITKSTGKDRDGMQMKCPAARAHSVTKPYNQEHIEMHRDWRTRKATTPSSNTRLHPPSPASQHTRRKTQGGEVPKLPPPKDERKPH